MNHLAIIQAILETAATPVSPLQMYQGQDLPYVVYDISVSPENTKAVTTALDIITLNVYIFNDDLDAGQTTADLIRQTLTTQKNTGVQSATLTYFDFDYVDQINSNAILQTYQVRMAYSPAVIVPGSGIGSMIVGSTFIIA
jgi:hypothetical protein